jgi:hypothetical protein
LWCREAYAISRKGHTHDIDQFVKRAADDGTMWL